jgi:hypothetical protein
MPRSRFFGAPSVGNVEVRGRVEFPTPNFQISFNSQAPNFKRDNRLGICLGVWVCHMREPADSLIFVPEGRPMLAVGFIPRLDVERKFRHVSDGSRGGTSRNGSDLAGRKAAPVQPSLTRRASHGTPFRGINPTANVNCPYGTAWRTVETSESEFANQGQTGAINRSHSVSNPEPSAVICD